MAVQFYDPNTGTSYGGATTGQTAQAGGANTNPSDVSKPGSRLSVFSPPSSARDVPYYSGVSDQNSDLMQLFADARYNSEQYNSAEAEKNRQWQEYMSNTAHQREVKDLLAAGLNPILSVTGGNGASTPAGSEAQLADNSSSIMSLMGAMMSAGAVVGAAAISANSAFNVANITSQSAQTVANINAKSAEKRAAIQAGTNLFTSMVNALTPKQHVLTR